MQSGPLFWPTRYITESVVADDERERNANKERPLHSLPNAGDVITERTVTLDRKRKCSNGDDDVSVGCRYRSSGERKRSELSKSMHLAGFTVERPIAVCVSSDVLGATPSSGTAVLQTIWSPPTYRCETTRSEPQVPDKRLPARRGYADNDDKLSRLPVGVVDMWQKNWNSAGTPRLIVEPTLCRESVLPMLLLSSSNSFCQLSN